MRIVPTGEIEKALRVANRIPGLYRRQEAEFLYRLGRRKGNLVELGCWMGRTTAILLQAAAIWGAQLTTVDAFTAMHGGRKAATARRWEANLKKVGLKPPRLLEMTTDEAAAIYPREANIGLLFIDAAHGYENVQRDLANWTQRIKIGGVVALHDMFFPSITGVCQAVTDWWCAERDEAVEPPRFSPRWELVGQRDYTIAFKRRR
jgi:predicted O-methyltransferase YrrM